jgi:hypothetical protein
MDLFVTARASLSAGTRFETLAAEIDWRRSFVEEWAGLGEERRGFVNRD